MGRIYISENSNAGKMREGSVKYIVLYIITVLLAACSNEIDLLEPAEPIPVVYGIICPDDSVHSVRLSRTFDGSETPEIDARVADSLYFKNAQVYLELRSSGGKVLERLEMVRSSIDDREPGIFAPSPNIVYQGSNFLIRQGSKETSEITYHLAINLPDYDKSVYSTARIPGDPEISGNIFDYEEISIFNNFSNPKKISISSNEDFASETIIEFFYDNKIDGEWIADSFIYKVDLGPGRGKGFEREFSPEWLYGLFANRIPENTDVEARRFNCLEITRKLISPEYTYYLATLDYSPDFYTGIFSNIVNGKGLFAAYSKSQIIGITFSDQMMDSLAMGKYTKELGFLRWR